MPSVVTFLHLLLFLNVVYSFEKNKNGPYKVYRVIPRTPQHLSVLSWIRNSAPDYEFDIWKDSGNLGDFSDIMVPPGMQRTVEEIFAEENMDFTVSIPDVFKLMKRNELDSNTVTDEEPLIKHRSDLLISSGSRLRDDPILDEDADQSSNSQSRVGNLKASYPFGDYGSYKQMQEYMREIEINYPNFTKIVRIGETHGGIPIEGIKIGFPINDTNKRAFWIDGNIHAREWASSHTALYFINQLVSGYGNKQRITDFVNQMNIFIFPCLNPDGYEYTRSEPSPQVRLWRKNRSPRKCSRSLWGGRRCCEGVDLNRNFDFHWSETGSSTNPCSNLYSGEKVFSEPEARAVRDFLTSDEMKGKVDGFITLHTYAQLWIHPYSHETESYPMDYIELKRTAKRAIDKLKSVYGTQFKIGTGADTLSPASGGSDDWAKGILGVKYVYLIELRPQLELSNGFILNKYELIPTAVETWEGVQVVIASANRLHHPSRGKARLPSQLLRKQLYRQLALHEDRQMRQHGEPIERSLDTGVQVKDRTITTPPRTASSQQRLPFPRPKPAPRNLGTNENTGNLPEVSPNPGRALTPASLVQFRNGSTTVFNTTGINRTSGSVQTNPAASGGPKPVTNPNPISGTGRISALLPVVNRSLHRNPAAGGGGVARQRALLTSSISLPHVPEAFVNPNCRDTRYSCQFWLRSNPNVCIDQLPFMRQQCAFTCRFCKP